MVDVHSHILPGIDDGSRDVEESVSLLRASARQGITVMAATSHYYPDLTSPSEFLRKREDAWQRLRPRLEPDFPRILLGAEVYYFEGISRVRDIDTLCIGDTSLLLLEMPFETWSDRMVQEVCRLNMRNDLTVLLAHIERYLFQQKLRVWRELLEHGVMTQTNASFFLFGKTKYLARWMLKRGLIHFLGSDCHNMDTRPPRLGECIQTLRKEDLRLVRRNMEEFFPSVGAGVL